MPSTDDDLRCRFDAAGLGAKASALLDLRRPGVRLISRPVDDFLGCGAVSIGGSGLNATVGCSGWYGAPPLVGGGRLLIDGEIT